MTAIAFTHGTAVSSTAGTASPECRRVASLPADELEAIMLRGEAPDLARLEGWEYRGTNTPAWAHLVGIKKFIKGKLQMVILLIYLIV